MPPLYAVALVVLLEVTCLGAILPVLNYYTLALGGGPALVGVFYGLVAAPKVVLNPLWGRMSDRIGRRAALALATGGALAASMLWALAPALGAIALTPLAWLGISRLLNGVFAAQATLAFAVASDSTVPERRAGAFGVLGAAFGIGLTLGTLLGGLTGSVSHAAVGWLCVGLETAALLVIFCLLRETRPEADRQTAEPAAPAPGVHVPARAVARTAPRPQQSLRQLGLHPALRWLLGSCLLLTLGYSLLTPTLGMLGERWFDFNERQTGYAFFIWGVLGVIVQGGLIRPTVRALGETRTTLLGYLALALGFLLIAIQPPQWLFWIAIGLIGLGGGYAIPPLTGLMSRHVDQRHQGGVHGLNQSVTALGRAISYFLGGALFAVAPALPYALAVGFVLVAIPLLLLAPRPGAATDQAADPTGL